MGRYKVKLDTLLPLINAGEYTLTGSYGEDNAVTIWTHAQLVNTIDYIYAERSILVPGTIDTADTVAQEAYFKSLFNLFKSENADYLARALLALNADYNPLENYSGKEVRTTEHGKQTLNTYDTTDSTTHGLKVNSSSDVFGFNSASAVPDSKAEVANSGTDSDSKTGTIKVADSGTDTETLTRAGNLGVTTSQQMINEELALRFQSFVNRAISSFLTPITIY